MPEQKSSAGFCEEIDHSLATIQNTLQSVPYYRAGLPVRPRTALLLRAGGLAARGWYFVERA